MRGLGNFAKGAVFLAGLLGMSAAAFAQADPQVPITFRQQVPADTCSTTPPYTCSGGVVSQSRTFEGTTFQSQVTYKFTIQNNGSSNLNLAFAKLTVANADGSTSDPASIDYAVTSLDGTSNGCTLSDTLTARDTMRCELGTLPAKSGQVVVVYFVVNVPKSGTQLWASWQGGGYEGNGGRTGCCQPTGNYVTGLVDKTVDASYKYSLQTFVKKEGTQLFTGDAYIPMPGTRNTTADLNTTFVGIPKIADTYGTNASQIESFLGTISESSESCTSAVFKPNQCYKSGLTISKVDFSKNGAITWFSVDGDFPNQVPGAPDELLDVIVRVDASAFKNGAKVEDVVVRYEGAEVLPCAVPTPNTGPAFRSDLAADTLLLAAVSLPCYTQKFFWPKNATPAALRGDLQVNGKHFKNGTWSIE